MKSDMEKAKSNTLNIPFDVIFGDKAERKLFMDVDEEEKKKK